MHPNPFNLDGHVSVVTGGNGGIGFGIAQALVSAGASVAIWGRDEDKSESAAAALDDLGGGRAMSFVCDVADEAQVATAMRASVATFGRIDSCFANAGVPAATTPFVDAQLTDWRRVMAVNLDGVFLTLRGAAKEMIEQGSGGSLVVTSSLTTILGAPRNEAYAAAKSGLQGLVRGLAVELGRYRIRVNAVVPGWIDTDLNHDMLASQQFSERVLTRVPIRRWGAPDDLGPLAVYLAGPGSTYHTGDSLVVDGGFSLS
jgi:NAD(P)-dependent dehydrogenase (short-subunit alcohol dehydrogenase family)